MTFFDIHELKQIKANSGPFLINDLTYLKDDTFLPINKLKSIGKVCDNENNTFNNIGWISKDSTTLDAAKTTRMCLDTTPMNSYQKNMWDIYDKKNDRYRGIYYHRENLPGQIQYYIDPQMANPFFPPLFPPETKALGSIYIDPMGDAQYDFRRSTGVCSTQQSLSSDDCGIVEFRDGQNHREDHLANIMRVRNKREYEPIYFNFTTRYDP